MRFAVGLVVLCITLSLAGGGGVNPARGFEDYPDSVRKYQVFVDSLDKAPPWIRVLVLEHHQNDKLFIPDSQNIRCVGRWPFGPSYQVTGQDSFVYLGSGSGVRIVNISDPRRPRHVGKVDALGLVGYGGGVVRKDTLLYVLSGNYGLQIFNITNPTSPRELGRLLIAGYHQDLAVKDSLAYVVGWDSLLRIISVTNPASPQQIASLKFNNDTWGVDVKDSFAYVANQTSGLRVVNVANPRNPREVGSIAAWRALETYASGNLVFVAAGAAGLRIVDVRNPASPQEIGYLLSAPCRDVMRIGMFAYGIRDSSYNSVFYVIDVSDSTNPSLISYVDPPGWGYALWVTDPYSYAYTADHWEGMHAINLNDPTQPRVDTVCFGASEAKDVFILADRAYVADWMAGLRILDISDIRNPLEIGSHDTIGVEPDLLTCWIQDTLAYLGDDVSRFPARFAIVNVRNANNVIRLGTCRTPGNIEAEDMFLKDSIIYTVHQSYLYGYSLNNPNSPTVACSLFIGGDQAYGLFVKDTFAYVEGTSGGLKIVNIARPSNPLIVGRCSTHYGLSVYVKDTIAYVGGGTLGLVIVNVANPNSPFEISRFPTRHWAIDVWIKDTLAFVDARAVVQIINIKEPRNPFETAYYEFYSPSRRLFYDGNYIYTANYEGGMYVFEQFTTGIAENPAPEQLFDQSIVTPNPVRRKLMVKFSPAMTYSSFRIFDIGGREVIGKKRLNSTPGGNEIDVSGLKSGVYFVILGDKATRKVVKIVKI